MQVSAEEMEAVQLQPWEKNYCADLHVKVKTRTRIKASDDPSSCDFCMGFVIKRLWQ